MGEVLFSKPLNLNLPSFITNNLLIHIDITNLTSYPAGGTTVFDLLGTTNYAFVNNVTYDSNDGPSLVLGDTAILNNSGVPAALLGQPDITVSMWMKRTGNGSSSRGTWAIGGGTTYQGVSGWSNNLTNRPAIDVWSGGTYVTTPEYPLNQWAFVTFQMKGGGNSFTRENTKIWINDQVYTGNNLIVSRNNTTAYNITNGYGMTIGEHRTGLSGSMPFKLGMFLVYNRYLSDSEVIDNYNATKSKFGL